MSSCGARSTATAGSISAWRRCPAFARRGPRPCGAGWPASSTGMENRSTSSRGCARTRKNFIRCGSRGMSRMLGQAATGPACRYRSPVGARLCEDLPVNAHRTHRRRCGSVRACCAALLLALAWPGATAQPATPTVNAPGPKDTFGSALSLGFCPDPALARPPCRIGALEYTFAQAPAQAQAPVTSIVLAAARAMRRPGSPSRAISTRSAMPARPNNSSPAPAMPASPGCRRSAMASRSSATGCRSSGPPMPGSPHRASRLSPRLRRSATCR